MRLVQEVASNRSPRGEDLAATIHLDDSVCYDFVVSLRALLNPRTYTRSRRWASEQIPRLSDGVAEKARFLFEGYDTALGYGAARVIPRISPSPTPSGLIDGVADLPAAELAEFMLDTGETTPERLQAFREILQGGERSLIPQALEGLPAGWVERCRRVLLDPEGVQADLVETLDSYLSNIYDQHLESATQSVTDAARVGREMLGLRPAADVIEHLTGGYRLGDDLELRSITLAPSVFIYPFMSARFDERTGEALIIYGVRSTTLDGYAPTPLEDDLVTTLKVLADPNRLTIMRLLVEHPLYTSELVSRLQLGQSTVHHHLAQLRAARLIRQQRDRHGMQYSVRAAAATRFVRSLEEWLLPSPSDTASGPESDSTPPADGQ